jgi:ubiquitin-protein ligase
MQEYSEIQHNPLEGVYIKPIDADMFNWQIELAGPRDSPYFVGSPPLSPKSKEKEKKYRKTTPVTNSK